MDWDKIVEVNTSAEVDIDFLQFDLSNPRFTPDKMPEGDTDVEIVRQLARSADLGELIQSIATSGFIKIEPLIVMPLGDKLTVLEGNRRLAAIKCLRDTNFAKDAGVSVDYDTTLAAATTETILVHRVDRKEDARDLIGFKHINGPQSWDAFAKAKFATEWLDSERALAEKGAAALRLKDIAGRMGDKHQTIFRMVTAYYVIRQAENEEIYQISDRIKKSFSFSHLYTGLSYPEFTDYLGMEKLHHEEDPLERPVPSDHRKELEHMLLWLYGSKSRDRQPVIRSQNPDLNTLKEVLRSKAAIAELEARVSLADAIVTATPKEDRFSQHLLSANNELLKAQNTLDGFDPETQSELEAISEAALKRASIVHRNIVASIRELEERR